jgi:hypothetical protein
MWGRDATPAGAKGRDQRPAYASMLKDVVRRFDVLMVWSIDRLGRSVLHVANALAELDVAGFALYSDQQAIDSTTPTGRQRHGAAGEAGDGWEVARGGVISVVINRRGRRVVTTGEMTMAINVW